MFYSDLKKYLFHKKKIIPTTGSHSLMIDLSSDVFFHIFYRHLSKISKIETALIGPKNRSRGSPKATKIDYFFSQENYCKSTFDTYSTYPDHT